MSLRTDNAPDNSLTVTLELTPAEAAALNTRASEQGTDIETVLHRIIAQITPVAEPESLASPSDETPPLTEKQKAAIAVLDSWRLEDATDDEEELRRRDAEFEDFKANINRWRAEEGRPPAFR
jgi:hypothetical protein